MTFGDSLHQLSKLDHSRSNDSETLAAIESSFEIDTKSSIHEELEELQGRERFIDEAI